MNILDNSSSEHWSLLFGTWFLLPSPKCQEIAFTYLSRQYVIFLPHQSWPWGTGLLTLSLSLQPLVLTFNKAWLLIASLGKVKWEGSELADWRWVLPHGNQWLCHNTSQFHADTRWGGWNRFRPQKCIKQKIKHWPPKRTTLDHIPASAQLLDRAPNILETWEKDNS